MLQRISVAIALAFTIPAVQCGTAESTVDEPAKPAAVAPLPAPSPPPPSSPPAGAPVAARVAEDAVKVPVDGLPSFGAYDALVTIVEFTDYECPYCAKAEKTIATLRAENGADLRVVVAPKPLPIHDRAPSAARAFAAAAQLGKAEEMHHRLFSDMHALDEAGLDASARAVGLGARDYAAAKNGPSTQSLLAKSEALATSLGVNGTPTFYVNGRKIVGAQPLADFRAVVAEELEKARGLVASGVPRWQVYANLMASARVATPPAIDANVPLTKFDVRVEGAPLRGNARAPVTIVMFSDFECPFCVRLEGTLRTLRETYPNDVRIAFRHVPLPMHEHARLAARAAIAAEQQGRFWEYHDALVGHRDALDRESLRRYARDVGLDLARFDRDLDDPRTEARLAADEEQARQLEVTGTPVAFVNGRKITGAQPLATFRAVVDRALATR